MTDMQKKNVQKIIMLWYKKYGRATLPWRHTQDLYKITVSEIMLQQTNVPKVIEKYHAFVKRFPTWQKLARARQASVVKQWQGLGYNRRALYLHKMAKVIVKDFDGQLPEDPTVLASLPGMGPYTRNAVLIFGRNKNLAAQDVNVDRVLRRIHGKTNSKKSMDDRQVRALAEEFVPRRRSRDWHNALMDFASLICTKRTPACPACPLKKMCLSYPNPQDFITIKRKEVGRRESGKHIPRRIYRGRVVEFLRSGPQRTSPIGNKIKKDWQTTVDKEWLDDLLRRLEKDGMIREKSGYWQLQ